ncbi:MAG TPA: DUF6603 domain-containing protein [Pilimelia sp.]|nr:DUF6603 domain-containing protein [Pilimelia sp.]
MSLDVQELGSFGDLATAIGLLDSAGQPNASWFGDPVGARATGTGNQHGLRHVLADNDQRAALLGFVDEVLGPPDAATRAGRTWVPLFVESNPHVTLYAVVETVGTMVHLGIGLEHTTSGGPPRVSTRVHVPIFRFATRGNSPPAPTSGLPDWLILGSPGGRVEIGVDVTLSENPPTPGVASLGGITLDLGVPTTTADNLAVGFELRDLQLPGAQQPRTFAFEASSLEELGTDVFDLVLGLVRAQADALSGIDPALAPFRAVAGLLGLRNVTNLPPLPLADLPTVGVSALVGWVETVLSTNAARDAWLGELATLVGGTLLAADDAVRVTLGPATFTIGVRVQPGTAGHPVVVPWVEVALTPATGTKARLTADLLRADTGTGACTALPDIRLEAVFGRDAGGATDLLPGTAPRVGSLHAGVALSPTGGPTFVLTLNDVDVTAGGPHHDVLDLSSPSAALDAASTAIEGALADAIDDLGPAGVLINRLLGLQPPTGIPPLNATMLLSDPLAAIRTYWSNLLGSASATADVLGRLRALVTGAAVAPAPGTGTEADPWALELVTGVELRVWRAGNELFADLVGSVSTPVLDEYEVHAELGVLLARVDLSTGQVAFVPDAHGSLALARQDGQTARLAFGALELEVDEISVAARWTSAHGLRAGLGADGLGVVVPALGGARVALPLPTFDADGRLTLPSPDWTGIEHVFAALLGELHVPVVDALVGLVGWGGTPGVGNVAHLSLEGLVGADPQAAVEAWLADLVLDCDRVRFALGPLAALLSGFSRDIPMGAGSARSPFRCPVAGEPRAPGLAVWLDPGCAPVVDQQQQQLATLTTTPPPSSARVVGVLRSTATVLPDVADLLVGRDSLVDGLDLLKARWLGTDGLVGRPATLPAGVTGLELVGLTYDELVAFGSAGMLVGSVLDPLPAAVLHVGLEATWSTGRPEGTSFDLTSGPAAGTVPGAGGGTWFVRLPTPAAAAAARPDRGAVGEMAARLSTVLAGRTDPIVVVAYGACGGAAVRAAATATAVSDVITVGSPWGPVAVDALRTGLGGDALRLLDRLRRPVHADWPDAVFAQEATPLQQTHLLVRRSLAAALSADLAAELPSAAGEARRTGLTVHAVFGALDERTLGRGIGAYVGAGIQARMPAAEDAAVHSTTARTRLHAGVDVPVLDLDLGGLLIGVGATLELCRVSRTAGSALEAALVRAVIVDVRFGVNDGWLVGGPGSSSTVGELRRMSARVEVPLDGSQGDAELVLHEARGFGVDRERWVVRADPAGAAADVPASDITAAVPEVRVLLSDAVARLRAASPDLSALLDLLGLTRDGGLDPDGLDRLLHDTASTMRGLFASSPGLIATRLGALVPAATGSGGALNWTVGPATIGVDLAAGALTGSLQVDEPGLPVFEVDVSASTSAVSVTAALGTLDQHAGGLRLVARTAPTASVAVEWAGPSGGTPTTRTVALLPTPDAAGLRDLATVLLPATAVQGLLSVLRELAPPSGQAALDAALDAIGLLGSPDELGGRTVVLPVGLVQDPGGWLRHAAASWRNNAASSAVALLDALKPLIAPGAGAGWQLATSVAIGYSVESGNRLRLVLGADLDVDLAGRTVTTHLAGGLLIGPDALPRPTLEIAGDVDGSGLRLIIDPVSNPQVRLLLLRAAPAQPLRLFPGGPGLGDALAAAGESVVPVVLNAVAGHRTDTGTGLLKRVAQAVFDLGDALDLRDGTQFTAAKLTTFAQDPGGRLLARLPQVIGTAAAAVAGALDPAGTVVAAIPATGKVTFGFGTTRSIKVVLDSSGATPAVELQADVTIAGVGRIVLEKLRLSTAGVDIAARLGPVLLDLGPFALRPLLVFRVGSALSSGRMVGLGLALDDAANRTVEFRWGLDANPPTLAAVTRTGSGAETLGTPEQAAQWLLALALSLAGGVVVDALGPLLTTNAKAILRGVVFTDVAGSTQIDPLLALDLLDPAKLLVRLKKLLWNAAQAPGLSITLDNKVTIGLVSIPAGTERQLGINVSLAAGQRFTIADGDTRVELEVDATWVNPAVPAGLSVYVLQGPSAASLSIVPGVTVAGLGLRFTKTSGPLLALGPVSLDGIAVQLYGEASSAGVGGGVNLELAGLSFAPGGGGGGNGVANGIMNDAGKSGASSRPAFSPSIAVQKHPGRDLAISLRAGPPPGPWWIVIQRQLGPLYLERVGFNTVEAAGKVTRVSLLFDGRVSIFGLTAAVDQLSINWNGGDILDISSWSVDLMGLAISADMSGVVLVGGILKTIGPPPNTGPVSYVGMLMGRFGTYGLSVFGGYTNDNGNPSFFVFGGFNGPIGGPPAFFLMGIGGGLGINRGLRIPDDPSTFNTFPFIQALDPAAKPPKDPMDELRKLNEYFPVQRGNFWFAAGIAFTCFSLVDGIAVIAVSFGDGFEINLLGLARLALPRPQAALVSIELGLLARFSTREGVFMIRAGLTENSWLLYKEVRLTGGFAFVIWWKGALAGQFVMTMGGYHPDFHRDGYPMVARLGLTWRLGDYIVIKGGTYFALTSEALMAGVEVEVSADFGWAWARLSFGAHAIIYFDPFHFEAIVFVRISAGVKIKTFLGTISFSISIGARLKVWGPDFSGEATFEVGPCSVTVPFGTRNVIEGVTLIWNEFVAKYLEETAAGSGTARALSALTGRGTLPSSTDGERAAPSADGSAERPFEVFSEFEISMVTTIPTASIDLGLTTGAVAVPVTRSDGMAATLGLKPMKAGNLSSTLRIRLFKHDEAAKTWVEVPDKLRTLGANLAASSPRPEGSSRTTDAYPIGTWGAPDLAGLPAPPLPRGDVIFAGNSVRLVAEAGFFARGPEIDYYKVEAARRPLPLQAGGPTRGSLLATAGTVDLPAVTTTAQALTAAQQLLFSPDGAVPAGALATGDRSALARAAYRGEVSAPPLFGNLADGMAAVNAADGEAERTKPEPAKRPRKQRPPMVAGYLTAGNGVAIRAGTTTVSDGRLKRRPAPTIDSVQARLGVHLPIQLHTTAWPAVVTRNTLAAPFVPRTVVAGAVRSYGPGATGLDGLVAGLRVAGRRAPRAVGEARQLGAGELVVLTMPDASVDPADGNGRPTLTLDGQARVAVLRGDGSVALDAVTTKTFPLPPGTALVAVQADGTTDPAGDGGGLAGWHVRMRISGLGSHAALGPGCVITADGVPNVSGVAWTTAGELLAGAAAVHTRFSRPVRTVAVVLETGAADRLDGVDLELRGAHRARGRDGAEQPPHVVLSGGQAVLIYAVAPDPKEPAVEVRVRAGGDWRVTGVLGGDLDVEALSSVVTTRGVAGATGRLLAGTGAGCRLAWVDRQVKTRRSRSERRR